MVFTIKITQILDIINNFQSIHFLRLLVTHLHHLCDISFHKCLWRDLNAQPLDWWATQLPLNQSTHTLKKGKNSLGHFIKHLMLIQKDRAVIKITHILHLVLIKKGWKWVFFVRVKNKCVLWSSMSIACSPVFHFGGNYINEYYNFLIFRIKGAIFAQNKKIWVNLVKFIKDLRIFSPLF